MTLSAQIPPPPAPPPASCLARCGACRWYERGTAEVGLCKTYDIQMRADAVACPQWCGRHGGIRIAAPRRADA